ncbi:MAG: hypothetical protein Q7S21_00295 [archaeon]|nr:hypothetical protein [archaeon]
MIRMLKASKKPIEPKSFSLPVSRLSDGSIRIQYLKPKNKRE